MVPDTSPPIVIEPPVPAFKAPELLSWPPPVTSMRLPGVRLTDGLSVKFCDRAVSDTAPPLMNSGAELPPGYKRGLSLTHSPRAVSEACAPRVKLAPVPAVNVGSAAAEIVPPGMSMLPPMPMEFAVTLKLPPAGNSRATLAGSRNLPLVWRITLPKPCVPRSSGRSSDAV